MAIDNASSIDIVATKPDDPIVHLVVADHLEWIDEEEHLIALQAKLNTYIAFVESGQLSRDFPESVGKNVQIEVVFLNAPHKATQEHFLQNAKSTVQAAGMNFTWRARAELA